MLATLVLALMLAACDQTRKPPRSDTTHVVTTTPPVVESITPRAVQSTWDSAAGPMMLVREDSAALAAVIFPQYTDSLLPDTVRFSSVGIRAATVDLFARSGRVGRARIATLAGMEWITPGATEWPTATLAPLESTSLPRWMIGFAAGRAQPVPLDSIAGATRVDSAQFVAEVARLASALPNDTASAFRGIPFAVRLALRFTSAPGVQALVADIIRRVPQEANPVEEHILLVAERDSGATTGRYHTVYGERTSGTEEGIETTEILAAVRIGSSARPTIVLERQGYESLAYSLLERVGATAWKVKWTSVHAGA
ncbi:MAG: hypothetical protein M3081_09885 [Gemmatimonadota bacterium]|nr:hypothetical protein [Gemmatimonadota bacterium]